ncbi:hypothetical protein [Rhizobium leguminosarum]|uniref:hypothetical protein n=1 Tax=Rhizobium leguminosarum TaxID=384 RepID=UPI001C956939|nr:hypothetical protein [Rhizobium leguminosarum]
MAGKSALCLLPFGAPSPKGNRSSNSDMPKLSAGIPFTRGQGYGPAKGLPNTKVGTFPQKLYDEAMTSGWTVISMKNDWKQIFTDKK